MSRQIARRLKDGRVELVDVPEPSAGSSSVAVRVSASVLSSGTERATLETARKSLVQKVRARPDQVKQVIDKARDIGVRDTMAFVRQRLEELGPLGYSAAGEVVEVGSTVRGVTVGDRVAIGGGGMANHAELDIVSSLLTAPVPDEVTLEQAAFATLGAIAINGFRRSEVQVGSRVAVIGLGLIGQLASRVARAAGCRVLGVDLRDDLLDLARMAGVEAVLRSDVTSAGWAGTADAVLVCAATTSTDPVTLAAELARDRAPVVVIGDVKMNVPRTPFYEKELDLRLSRSYGPGRYDASYEVHGLDYPIGYVRWTEQRNMVAFLDLVADGKLDPLELVSHRVPFSQAEDAFSLLSSDEPVVAIVLGYGEQVDVSEPEEVISASGGGDRRSASFREARRAPKRVMRAKPRLGLIGAGGFATATIIPGLMKAGFELGAVASQSGLSAEGARRRFGFEAVSADAAELLARDDLDLVVVATRHDSHARLATQALEAGVAVYVEKPLALSFDELTQVRAAQMSSGAPLLVGFNRRYAPLAAELRALRSPRLMVYRVNAGRLDPVHWTNDLARGGGRLKGEGCHFVDFLCDQAAGDPVSVLTHGFTSSPVLPLAATDNFSLQITFADGSVGTLHYAADAPTGPGKERFESSAPGAYAVLEDFRKATIWSPSKRSIGRGRQDKGWAAQYSVLAEVVRGTRPPPSIDSYVVSTLTTLAAARSLETGHPELVFERLEGVRPSEAAQP